MAITATIDVRQQDLLASLKTFCTTLLEQEAIKAVLVPQRLPTKSMVMPTLVTDPAHLEGVDPLSPAFPMNGAKVLAKLTRRPSGGKIAALLRPCEMRAFVELVKLKQARTEDVVLVSLDCLGALRNTDYFRFAGDDAEAATRRFTEAMLAGTGLVAMIGKAERGEDARLAIARHGAGYLIGIGGAGYLISKAIKAARVVAFADLGMEAIHEFVVEEMPVTVAIDSRGNSIHYTGPKAWREKQARTS